jgi:Spy/CpxP family protein refolding chaperone
MTKRFKVWLAISLIGVFVAGIASGLFAGAIHARHLFMGRHGGFTGQRMREHLRRELHLTPEQYEKVAPIIDRTSAQLEAIRNETGQRVAQTMKESHSEIAPLLTPEQREKLERMRERHRHIIRLRGGLPPPHEH